MQLRSLALLALLATATAGNPLAKVIEMIDALTAKVVSEGEAEEKAYVKFFEWCDDSAKNAQNDLANAGTKKADLDAKIGKLTADIADSTEKIDGLVADITKDSKELSDATAIREKEHADFSKAEAELEEGLDTLGRAIGIIEKEMAKHSGVFTQVDTSNLNSVLKAMSTILDAAAFPVADKKKLVALVQAGQNSDADDEDTGAPAGAAFKSSSGGILDVLQDMKEKAEAELDALRKEETSAKNNYEMLKQSLEDSMSADTKDKEDEQASAAADGEEKAAAEGELTSTLKNLKEGAKALETLQNDCMQTATDHAASKAGRTEELRVIAEAKKILVESSGGAVDQTYSFLQTEETVHVGSHLRLQTRRDLANKEIVTLVQQMAKDHHSAALTQLASKIATVLKFGAESGADPFSKIKGLITDMIAKLEKEADEDATEKAYCDEQMSKTEAKKTDLNDDVAKLTSKIDKSTATSAELKEDVKVLQAELAALTKEQTEMDKIRQETHAAYVEAKADLEAGLGGVRKALEMLRGYYGGSASASMLQQPKMPEYHSGAKGAGSGIISMLEVVESDFAKNLAAEEKEEADAAEEYDAVTQENAVTKTNKEADVEHKTQEHTRLDKSVADLTADRETTNSELSAVMEYYEKVKDRCIAKPESYAEIKARRDAEIQGLNQALTILEGEAAFAQGKKRGREGRFLGM